MKILLVSDSHGDDQILKTLYNQYPNMDLYLHAGDSQSNPENIKPFISVMGNCDYNYDFLDHIKIKTPYGYLYMEHDHGRDFKELLENPNIKIYVCGHTHIPEIKKVNDKYFINPGSISQPRSYKGKTYAILDINKDKILAKIHKFKN